MAAVVEVRVQDENPRQTLQTTVSANSTGTPPYPVEESPGVVIVRAEEVLLVVLVLMIWVAAIALFFNRWGKIRMLEPYQPKFQQQHRASCPMGDSVISPQQRMSFSKYNVNCMGENSVYTTFPSPNPMRRPRQNSVFVGSPTMAVLNPPRRVKSAIDIQHMVLSDYSPGSLSGCSSLLPILSGSVRDKRPSITIERPQYPKHRASIVLDQPLVSYHYHPSRSYLRRPSCLVDRPNIGRHKQFISFDQPTTSWDRRTSITIERPSSSSRAQPVFSFERHSVSLEQPSLIVEPPSTSQEHPPTTMAEGADLGPGRSCPASMHSLHQSAGYPRRPSFHLDMPPASPQHRLSASLDNPTCRMERSSSDIRSASTSFDETQIKLSNLETSKVSDV